MKLKQLFCALSKNIPVLKLATNIEPIMRYYRKMYMVFFKLLQNLYDPIYTNVIVSFLLNFAKE